MASSKPHAVVELTLARLREFLREPEAVFWVFAFPVLMALALGIAFRQEREQELVVGVVQEAGSPIADALRGARNIRVSELTREEAEAALRGGEVMLVVVPGEPPTYRFDPTRPESRTARLLVD